jgi:aryl-alcohol dehydrogenase-like predicted oxidoreductase
VRAACHAALSSAAAAAAKPPNNAQQVCTKYCIFSGRDMATLNGAAVRTAVDLSRQRLGVDKIDLMQLYWNDVDAPK